jgi:amidase
MLDPVLSDATSQLQALATGRITALELLEAALSRRQEVDRHLNCVVAVDPQPAVARARAIDERRLIARRNGEDLDSLGLLAGLPMTVKDTFDVDGMPASSGLARLKGRLASDADVVGLVRAANANVWGKTNVPELGGDWQSDNRLYGRTRNPWDLARTPGGSSGGAAAAVAAGVSALEVGSDLAGSLRVPASFCGVFCHKPTYGLVSMRGSVPPGPGAEAELDLAVAGPLARSARDLRLLLSVLSSAPIPARAPRADLVGLRVGVWTDEPAFVLDPQVRRRVLALAEALMDAGVTAKVIESPVNGEALLRTYATLLLSQTATFAAGGERALYEALRGPAQLAEALGAPPFGWASCVRASTARHREWLAANETRARLKRIAAVAFEELDVILAPAAPIAAFPRTGGAVLTRKLALSDGTRAPYLSLLHWAAFATVLGLPATTVPAGLIGEGLPVGVQVIGPEGGDSRTLAVAETLEEVACGFTPPPLERLMRETDRVHPPARRGKP